MAGCAVYAEAPLAYQAAGDEAWDHALGFGKRYATPQLHDPCAALQSLTSLLVLVQYYHPKPAPVVEQRQLWRLF